MTEGSGAGSTVDSGQAQENGSDVDAVPIGPTAGSTVEQICGNSVTATCVLAAGHKGWCSRDTPYVTIAQLRAALEAAQGENRQLREYGSTAYAEAIQEERVKLLADLDQARERETSGAALRTSLAASLDRALAIIDVQNAVLDCARGRDLSGLPELKRALAKLDAAGTR